MHLFVYLLRPDCFFNKPALVKKAAAPAKALRAMLVAKLFVN